MKPNVENYSWSPEESQAATLPLPFLSVFFVSEHLLHLLPVIQCPSFAHELRLLRASRGPATESYGSSTHIHPQAQCPKSKLYMKRSD